VKIKNRQQLLAIVAGAVVAFFAADKLLLTPLTASWKARATRVAELRKKVEDGRSLLQREQGLRSRWEQMRRNALPNNPSLAEQQVLKAFDRWSQESRVSIMSISPQWKHDADDYMTLECRVEAAGNLNTVSRFLYDLEKDPMALKLQMVEISARDSDGQQLALGLQVSGLVLTPQEQKR
jgi:hypothetical protein